MRHPITYIARIFIEFPSGFRIGTGQSDHLDDNLILTDCNGLPFIPGTSLCGAFLSHLRTLDSLRPKLRLLFGFQDQFRLGTAAYPDGKGSRVTFSHAHLLNAQGETMDGVRPTFKRYDKTSPESVELGPDAESLPPVLASARVPLLRDHVRINSRGVADHHGKFTRSHVPGGHRFVFDMSLEGDEKDQSDWDSLLNEWKSGAFRMGGATRQGLGRFDTVLIRQAILDLRKSTDWSTWKTTSPRLRDHQDLPVFWLKNSAIPGADSNPEFRLRLESKEFWMFGGTQSGNTSEALTGPVPFHWKTKKNGSMSVSDHKVPTTLRPVIPFTGVKGPLRHRLSYHYDRIVSYWAPEASSDSEPTAPTPGELAARNLFGWASDKPRSGDASLGLFLGDDVLPEDISITQTKRVEHVALDPFTGGPVPGALFSERPFFSGRFTWKFQLSDPKPLREDPHLLEALIATLGDLGSGDLVLGKGAGKGRFHASPEEMNKLILDLRNLVNPTVPNPEPSHP